MTDERIKITIETNADKAGTSVDSLKGEIQSLRKEIDSLDTGTEEYYDTLSKLAEKVEEEKDRMDELKLATEGSNIIMDNSLKVVTNVASGFSTLNSVLSICGLETEDTQAAMLKLQQGMALVQGLSGLKGMVKNFGDLSKSLATSVKLMKQMTKESGSLGKSFKTVISSGNAYVAVIMAVVAAISLCVAATRKQAEANRELVESGVEKFSEKNAQALEQRTEEMEYQLELLKAQGKSEMEILKTKKDLLWAEYERTDQELKANAEKIMQLKDLQKSRHALNTEQQIELDKLEKIAEILKSNQQSALTAYKNIDKEIALQATKDDTAAQAKAAAASERAIQKAKQEAEAFAKSIEAWVDKMSEKVTAETDEALQKIKDGIAGLDKDKELIAYLSLVEPPIDTTKEWLSTMSEITKLLLTNDKIIKETNEKYKALVNEVEKENMVELEIRLAKGENFEDVWAELDEKKNKLAEQLADQLKELEIRLADFNKRHNNYLNIQLAIDDNGLTLNQDIYEKYTGALKEGMEKIGDVTEFAKTEIEAVTDAFEKGKLNAETAGDALLYYFDKLNSAVSENTDEAAKKLDEMFKAREISEKYLNNAKAFIEKAGGVSEDMAKKTAEIMKASLDIKFDRYEAEYEKAQNNILAINEDFFLDMARQNESFWGIAAGSYSRYFQNYAEIERQELETANALYDAKRELIDKEIADIQRVLENEQLSVSARLEMEKQLADATYALEEAGFERQEAINQARVKRIESVNQSFVKGVQGTYNILGDISTALSVNEEKNAKAIKGVQKAQAIVNALLSANEAYSSMASIPYVGPALGAVAAAAALAAGIANVKAIEKTDMSGNGSVSAGSTPSASGLTGMNSVMYGNMLSDDVNTYLQPQIAAGMQDQRVYVVQGDITESQEEHRATVTNATF